MMDCTTTGNPKWIMVCTYGGDCWLLDVVDNEIEAIKAYRDHVRIHGLAHSRHISMYRMTEQIAITVEHWWMQTHDGWVDVAHFSSSGETSAFLLKEAIFECDEPADLFRPPDLKRNVGVPHDCKETQ